MAKGKPAEILRKEFAKEFVSNGFNATKAIQVLKPEQSPNVAKATGSRILTNIDTRREISALLEENGITVSEAMKVHKRNMEQDKQLGVSQTAVQDVYKLAGIINRESNTPVNIGVFIKQ